MGYHISNAYIQMEKLDKDRLNFDFEDHFNKENISSDKIRFAKYYLEDKIGVDLEEDPMIVFSPIGSTVFGYLVAHIVVEYEKFIGK